MCRRAFGSMLSRTMSDRLRGKVAIVTGAGSRGPGLGHGKGTAGLFPRGGARGRRGGPGGAVGGRGGGGGLGAGRGGARAGEPGGLSRGGGGEAAALAADVTRAADC